MPPETGTGATVDRQAAVGVGSRGCWEAAHMTDTKTRRPRLLCCCGCGRRTRERGDIVRVIDAGAWLGGDASVLQSMPLRRGCLSSPLQLSALDVVAVVDGCPYIRPRMLHTLDNE